MERTRTLDRREKAVDRTTTFSYTFWSGSYSESIQGPNILRPGISGTMTDWVTPGFRKKMREGRDVSNPCSYQYSVLATGGGTANVSYTSGDGDPSHWVRASVSGNPFTRFQGIVGSEPSWFSNDISSAGPYLLQEAVAEALSSDFDGSLFAAEAVKTLKLIRHPFQGITSLLAKMDHSRTRLAKAGVSAAKAASQSWLEYRYGWKPLMYDIRDATAALFTTQRVPGIVLRTRKSKQFTYSGNSGPVMVGSNAYYRWWVETQRQHTGRVRAGVRYRIVDPSYRQFLSTALGLSLDNLPGLAWELVPFSFVLDWFVDVGTWIRTITPSPHIEILSNYISTDIVRSYHSTLPFVEKSSPDGYGSFYRFPAEGYLDRVDRSGSRVVNQPVSTHPIVVPGALSLTHWVDSTALSFNQLMRSLRSFKH